MESGTAFESGTGTNEVAVDCLLNDIQLLVSSGLAILRLKLGACPKVQTPGNHRIELSQLQKRTCNQAFN
jgi:hypothetical protein